MISVWKAEKMKYRHSIWKLFFFLIPIIPAIIGTINYQQNIEILKNGWYSLWTQHTLFYAFFFFSPLIAIAASFLWRVEHKGKNWNLYLTGPASLLQLYTAKFLVLVELILEIQFFVAILFVISGYFVGLRGMVPWIILWWLIRGTMGALVIAAVQMCLAMVIHNFAIPVLIGFLGGISGFLMASGGFGTFYPYSQLMMGMNSNRVEDVLKQGNGIFFCVSFIYFIVFYAIGVFIMKKRDCK